jgi:hypothetical protein
MLVVHGTKPAAGDTSTPDYTAQALSLDGGSVSVAIAGIALVAIGIIMAVRGPVATARSNAATPGRRSRSPARGRPLTQRAIASPIW